MHRLSIAIPSPNCPAPTTPESWEAPRNRSEGPPGAREMGCQRGHWRARASLCSLQRGSPRATTAPSWRVSPAMPCHERVMEANMPQNCQKTLDQSESGVHKCLQTYRCCIQHQSKLRLLVSSQSCILWSLSKAS